MDFYNFLENIKTIIGYWTRFLKNYFQNYFCFLKEFLGNKIADAVTKPNDDKIVKQEPIEEIIIPLEKKR